MKVLIVADGDVPTRAALTALLGTDAPALVIAADGGALKALELGFVPHVVIGDADSLATADLDRLRGLGAEVIVHPTDKDESDTELCLREAVACGADELLIVGGFGGRRIEHTVANLLLLCLPELAGCDACLADGVSVVRLLGAGHTLTISGESGDFVSLLPLVPLVEGVTTDGLDFALIDEALVQGLARGLSNVMSGRTATVSLRSGRLLVVHTRNSQ